MPQRPPALWLDVSTALEMPPGLQRRVWHSLARARWSEAVSLRQAFLLHDKCRGLDMMGWLRHSSSPLALVQTLEALVQEGLLARQEATDAQERVLTWTDAAGHWR